MKKNKNQLRTDTVQSDSFHVGIELELYTPMDSSHDDDACERNRYERHEEYINDMSDVDLMREFFGVNRHTAQTLEPYFDRDQWQSDHMDGYDTSCDEDCDFTTSAETFREDLGDKLVELTGNTSFKVVSDGSIRAKVGSVDTEVCWNYFASKSTIKDNSIILNYLHDHAESEFNDSCGLHINLNDYLREKSGAGAVSMEIPTRRFDPLWRLVAPSRRENTYCNRQAFSRSQKYSMIFAQADRWEFRFFSPTLDAVKMNHYVQLANVMYRRLNGQPAQLSVATMEYFVAKMKADPRKFTDEQIHDTLVFVNTLRPLVEMDEKFRVGGTYMSSELDEAIVERTFVDKDRFAWPVFDGMPSIQFLLTNPMVRTSPLYF